MAKKYKVKKNKVTGSNGNDNIKWEKSWKKAMTVNAGNGNDIINFKKSKYNNKLNGQAGNDTIYGGKGMDTIDGGIGNDTIYGGQGNDVLYGGDGNDVIYGEYGNNVIDGGAGNDTIYGGAGNELIFGGKGNDIIYTGAGNDYIYYNRGDGNDTIYKGTGKDTLVFSDEKGFARLGTKFVGDDLVIYYDKNNSVTLKDYAHGHSVNTLQFQNYGVSIDSILPEHQMTISENGTFYGTDLDDIINFNATSAGPYSDIYIGKGNDTVNMGGGTQRLTVHLKAGEGDLSINNFDDCDDESTLLLKTSDYNITRKLYDTTYIKGRRSGDSLEIALTSGEIVRIDNYFNLTQTQKNNILYGQFYSFDGSIDKVLRTSQINLTEGNADFDGNANNTIIMAEDDVPHLVAVEAGQNNTIVLTGNNSDWVYVDLTTPGSSGNKTIVDGAGNKYIEDHGNASDIYVNNKDANATINLFGNSSYVYTCAGTNTITTAKNLWNYVEVYTASDADTKATATINVKGTAVIETRGDVTVNMTDADYDLDWSTQVRIHSNGLTTTIQHAHQMTHLDGNTSYYQFWDDSVKNLEWVHDKNESYVSVYALDSNGNRLDGVLKFDMTGGTFDSAPTNTRITFETASSSFDEFHFSDMNKYVDMSKYNYAALGNVYNFNSYSNGAFDYVRPNETIFDSKGENSKYSEYNVTGYGKNVVTSATGDDDTLSIANTLSEIKVFFDIKSNGTLASNDLYFFNETDLEHYLQQENVTDSFCIKDYFGDGKVETIRTSSKMLKDNVLNDSTNQLISEVQAWLTTEGFGSVGQAIQSGLDDTQATTLIGCYEKVTGANYTDYWNAV